MNSLEPASARVYWKALLDNATQLIADAHLLFDNESFGRARALTVLAEEELGKALTVYQTFEGAWTTSATTPIALPVVGERDHLAKYQAAFEFGRELEAFWGSYGDLDYPEDDDWERWISDRREKAQHAAQHANRAKQRGFYVDLSKGQVLAPSAIDADNVGADLTRAAQVIEMMLIKDHTRMQDGPPGRYDSTHDLQWRVMPTSHPEEFADFAERVKMRLVEDEISE